jgi:hypothetical protein
MRGSGSRSVVGRCGCGGGFGRQAVSARGGLLHHPLRGMFRHRHQNNNNNNNNNSNNKNAPLNDNKWDGLPGSIARRAA